MLILAGVLALAVTVGALLVVVGSRGDDTAASTTVPTAPTSAPTTPVSSPDTTVLPPATSAPVTTPAPVTGGGSVGALRGSSEVPYGSYVAVLWSEVIDSGSEARADGARAAKGSNYGVPTAIVYGDDFRSLKDGTIAVVYAGGFASPRDAAQWCWDRGVRDVDSCFGVGLNDDYGVDDRNGTGRMYISEL